MKIIVAKDYAEMSRKAASILQVHPVFTLVIDEEAASLL